MQGQNYRHPRGASAGGPSRGGRTVSTEVPLYQASRGGVVRREDEDVSDQLDQNDVMQIDAPANALHVKFTCFYEVTYWGRSDRFRQIISRTHSGELVLNVPQSSMPGVEGLVKKALDREWEYIKDVKEAQSEKGLNRQYIMFSFSRPGLWNTRDLRYVPMRAFTVLGYDQFNTEDRPTGRCVFDLLIDLYAPKRKFTVQKLMRIFADRHERETLGWDDNRHRIRGEERYFYKGEPYTPDDGVDATQLLKFAQKQKLNLFGFGLDGECFIKHQAPVVEGPNGNRRVVSNLKPLIFLLANEHIYFLRDRQSIFNLFNERSRGKLRNTLQDVTRKGDKDGVSARARRGEYPKVMYTDALVLRDVRPQTSVYFTESDDMSPVLYRVIAEEKRVPGGIRVNDGRVVSFCYSSEHDVFYYCCPDFAVLQEVFAVLREDRFQAPQPTGDTDPPPPRPPPQFEERPVFLSDSIANVGRMLFHVLNPRWKYMQSQLNARAEEVFTEDTWQPAYKAFYDVAEGAAGAAHASADEYVGVDISKCYTAAMLNSEKGWPVYSAFDEVTPYDGLQDLKVGFYYVQTHTYFPLKGNGWYCTELVEYCLAQGIIARYDVRFQLVASRVMPAGVFKTTIDFIFHNFPSAVAKQMMMFYGFFNRMERTVKDQVIITLNQYEAGYYYMQHEGASVEEVNSMTFFDQWNTRKVRRPDHFINLNPVERMDLGADTVYRVDVQHDTKDFFNMRPVYCQVVQLGMMYVHRLWCAMGMGARVLQIKTDSVLVHGGTVPEDALTEDELRALPLVEQIGRYKICTTSILDQMVSARPRRDEPIVARWDGADHPWREKLREPPAQLLPPGEGGRDGWDVWVDEVVEDYLFNKGHGFLLTGKAGTGKTTFVRRVCKLIAARAEAEGEVWGIMNLAPTNKAAILMEDGQTIDKAFGSCGGTEFSKDIVKEMRRRSVRYVFVDEGSMVGENSWHKLLWLKRSCPGLVFIVAADFHQCMPVEGAMADDAEGEAAYQLPVEDQASRQQFVHDMVDSFKWDDRCKGRANDLTTDSVFNLIERHGNTCRFCHRTLRWESTKGDDYDHQGSLDRFDNRLGHTLANVNLCCVTDNLQRNKMNAYQYEAFGNIVDHARFNYKHSWVLKYLTDFNRVKLTQNKRSDDEMFDICENVMARDVEDHFDADVFAWRNLVFTNRRRKAVNAACMRKLDSETGGERLHFDAVEGDTYSQAVTVQVGTPLIAKKTDRAKLKIAKNEMFKVHHMDLSGEEAAVYLLCEDREPGDGEAGEEELLEVTAGQFNVFFHVAFAVTVHKSQGSTFDERYAIHEFRRMSRNLRYTALTRTTRREHISLVGSMQAVFGEHHRPADSSSI